MNNEYKILIEQISKRVLLVQENNNIINIIDCHNSNYIQNLQKNNNISDAEKKKINIIKINTDWYNTIDTIKKENNVLFFDNMIKGDDPLQAPQFIKDFDPLQIYQFITYLVNNKLLNKKLLNKKLLVFKLENNYNF
jgi:hypothetical protein